ncbi:MAG TPA: SDR family oxidoreductase [Frankiaceae bacterium]|nr:SDR family oxidoreductase [Frankiaceae bacterium]
MGKSVVITGANSGIGLVTAIELAKAGYEVFGTARSAEKASELEEQATAQGVSVTGVVCDVSDPESCDKGFTEIANRTGGGPDAVINNAGTAQAGAIEDVSDELVHQQLEINLVAPARVARIVLPHMREQGSGHIINISSIAGRMSLPMMGWYCASKHGLEAMTDALRVEAALFGVKVTLIEPGSFGTSIWASGAGSMPEPSNPVYAGAYTQSKSAISRDHLLPDPIWVARTIRLALASPVPLARYLVGVDAVTGAIAENLAPTMVSDVVKGVATGLRKLPFTGR